MTSSGPTRGVLILSGGGIAAALLCILLFLTTGRTAQARSVVNSAPAAAEKSRTVRFQSVLNVTVDGHPRDAITERGAIDFATGAYTTAVRFANADQMLERRSVNGVFYAAERSLHAGARPRPLRWIATRREPAARGTFASEADAFTDPPSVFRVLSGTRAPVKRAGRENLNGIPATRYQLQTSLASFLRASAGHIQNPLAYRRVRAALDLWVDARGRPLRVDETFTGPSGAGHATMTTVLRFTGYERPVSVLAPANAVLTRTTRSEVPSPLAGGPGSFLARRLFFQAAGR